MIDTLRVSEDRRPATPSAASQPSRIPVIPLGLSLGLFLSITYVLCVGFDLLFPNQAMHETWARLLPGFVWLSWPGFVLGLVETFAYGWYVALIFGPLFDFFASWRS